METGLVKNLGIDIGGVIISRQNDDTDTSFFGSNFLNTTAEPLAFETILKAYEHFDEIHLVSKCGDKVQRKTREWLEYNNFYNATGVSPDNLHFCRKRYEKVGICRELGITAFIDDRLEILTYMLDHVQDLYLFKPQDNEVQRVLAQVGFDGRKKIYDRIDRVNSWSELLKKLDATRNHRN
jgi:hypothetical protein